MASYRIGQAAELLGLSIDSVRRLTDSGRLQTVRSAGRQRLIDGSELARFAAALPEAQRPEVIVGQSARNRFPGIVTREAADELGLAPGVRVVAAIKATNVVVELPTRAG